MSAESQLNEDKEISTTSSLIQARDFLLLAGLAGIAIPAWLLPQRLWPGFADRVARLTAPLIRHRTPRILAAMQAASANAARGGEALYADWIARRIEQESQYLREYRPGGWRPRLSIEGAEHLEQSIASGHGGILWVAPQLMAGLIVKKALHEAGFAVSHLSREYHGASDSRFGRRFINPISIRCENRYVAARFPMQANHELKALRPLIQALNRGQLVSITCASYGQRLVRLPLSGGELPVATGAAMLALRGGADLLPVFLRRRGAAQYSVVVQKPLERPANAIRREAVGELMQAYAERLQPMIEADPASFADWRNLRLPGPGR